MNKKRRTYTEEFKLEAGVLVALLARRKPFVALGVAPLLVLAIMTPLISTIVGGPQNTRTAYVSEFIGIMFFMLIPLILTHELMRAARFWLWFSLASWLKETRPYEWRPRWPLWKARADEGGRAQPAAPA